MYALTGANGHLGRLTLQHLLELVPADQIVATTRNPQALSDLAARGVQVRRADFGDPATLAAAFEGVARLLIISTDAIGRRADQHRAAIDAAARAGAGHIVYTSAPAADPHAPSPILQEHGLTEAALAASGVPWTALRNSLYAEVVPNLAGALLAGDRVLVPEGPTAPAWVTREDCARTAAFVLAGKAALSGAVDVTGPQALNLGDVARRWYSAQGRTVAVQSLPDEALVAELIAKGLPEEAARGVLGIAVWAARGEFSAATDTVERATGTAPAPVDAVFRAPVAA